MKSLLIAICIIFSLNNFTKAQSVASITVDQLEQYLDTCSKKVMVVNFWATFCKPCVAELPHFIDVSRQFNANEVGLLMVSVDGPEMYPRKLKKFIRNHHFKGQFAWLNESDASYFCPKIDPAWSGSIPATLMVNIPKKKRHFLESEMSAEELKSTIFTMLAE